MITRCRMQLILLVLAAVCSCASLVAGADKADDLIKQRDASSNGIIALDDASFSKYADRSDRSYSLVVFFTAKGKESPQLKMKEIFDNFALVAKHVKKKAGDREHQAAANKVFFTTLEFSQSQRSFAQLGVKAIPWVLHLRPGLSSAANGMWNIQEKDKMKMEDYGARVFTPSHYSDFIKARTGHDFGTVHVPTPLERPEVLAMIVSLLAMLAYVGWKVYTSRWIGHPAIWTAACLFVFAFAASGGLYNIIRGVPMVSQQGNKVTWFMQGQGQLGAEGFVAGSMYIIFALSCFGLINAPNWLGSLHKSNYHVACYVLLAVAVIVFQRIVGFYTQKTGYHLRYYLIDWLQGVRS